MSFELLVDNVTYDEKKETLTAITKKGNTLDLEITSFDDGGFDFEVDWDDIEWGDGASVINDDFESESNHPTDTTSTRTSTGITNADTQATTATKTSAGGDKVNLKDASAFYAEIDGIRFTVGDPISKLIAAGYTMDDKYLNEELKKNFYSIISFNKGNKRYVFSICVINASNTTKTIPECTIGGFTADNWGVEKISSFSTINGLTIGSSVSDVESAFGSCSDIYRSDDSEYMTYTYKSEIYDRFVFTFRDGKSVSGIEVRRISDFE